MPLLSRLPRVAGMLLTVISLSLISQVSAATPAPDFALKHAQLPAKLSDLKGQVIYLDFWASWCKPCRQSFPWMNQMQQTYADKGLQVLTINLDTESELAQQFLAQIPANFPIVYDPEGNIAEQYALVGMPSSYLIDADGIIRYRHKGFFTQQTPRYEQEIQQLLQERGSH